MARNDDRPVVQLIGDGIAGRWLSWRWSDSREFGVHRVEGLDEALAAFHAALPRGDAGQVADLRLDGPLAREKDELKLMTRLAECLLPKALRGQLLDAGRVDVRIMPSPATARIPWGLLPVGDKRLIESSDVSWIGPILPRDVAPLPETAPAGASYQALYVIDPLSHGANPLGLQGLTFPGMTTAAVRTRRFTPEQLAEELEQDRSRLFLLGHVQQRAHHDGETSFAMTGGNLGAATVLREKMHVPPRVAIVACGSGVDLVDPEPLGLATAFLIQGADTVLGTLWPLPTDTGLAQANPSGEGAFEELAVAIDEALMAEDPVATLCEYQRERLKAWRKEPTLRNSPLVWGAAMAMTAPRERHLDSQQPAGDGAG